MPPVLARLDPDRCEPLGIRLCNWVREVALMLPSLRRLHDAGYDLQLVGRGWAGALTRGQRLAGLASSQHLTGSAIGDGTDCATRSMHPTRKRY